MCIRDRLHRESAAIYRCSRQGVTPNRRALGETKHAAPVTAFRFGGPERRAGAWVRAGAALDFQYPPYDINALAFSSPAHSIRWAVKVSRATAPGFGSYVGV